MDPIRITARLDSETLILPELRPFLGKLVEIRVAEAGGTAFERWLDHEYHAELDAEAAADSVPVPSLDEVRGLLADIPGSMTADFAAERDERL
ncbi:MAG: hypothetical protein ACRC7O_17900 [Fimbriiglobus sp.]